MSNVTIKDIARRLKVSATTVTNALNDKPGVGEAVRRNIIKLAKEMGINPIILPRP
jgi:DNA-binding LacI/PurR family transcriptional regulator